MSGSRSTTTPSSSSWAARGADTGRNSGLITPARQVPRPCERRTTSTWHAAHCSSPTAACARPLDVAESPVTPQPRLLKPRLLRSHTRGRAGCRRAANTSGGVLLGSGRFADGYPRIGGLLLVLRPPPAHERAWGRGAEGEERVAAPSLAGKRAVRNPGPTPGRSNRSAGRRSPSAARACRRPRFRAWP
jgi:hypothetical protein